MTNIFQKAWNASGLNKRCAPIKPFLHAFTSLKFKCKDEKWRCSVVIVICETWGCQVRKLMMRVCWCWCQDKCQLGQNNEPHNLNMTDIPPQYATLQPQSDLDPPLSGVTGQLGSGLWVSSQVSLAPYKSSSRPGWVSRVDNSDSGGVFCLRF